MTDYLFVGGCPRSGTSLLSALIGNIRGVGVVQDLTAIYQLKNAALRFLAKENGVQDSQLFSLVLNTSCFKSDLRTTEFFPQFLSKTLDQCLNGGFSNPEGRLLRTFIGRMDVFLFHDYNKPDPRKDRSSGASYLSPLSISKMLECDSMRECFLSLLHQSCLALAPFPAKELTSEFSLLCEKTPENNVANDVISLLMNGLEYRYINLVRDPVAVYGARKQRVPSGVQDFVNFHYGYAEPAFKFDNNSFFYTLRYEDLVTDPNSELIKAFNALNLEHVLTDSNDLVGDQISPGKYVKYVGSSIDLARDQANRSMVSEDEKFYIYQKLGPFCEKYSYGPYA